MSSSNKNRNKSVTIAASVLLIIEAAAFALMCLMLSSVLPMKFLGIVLGVCVLLIALQIILVAGSGRRKGRGIASIVISIILCAAAVLAILFMKNFHDSLSKMTDTVRQKSQTAAIQTINIYVRKADNMTVISDLKGRSVGVLQDQDTANTELALQQIETEIGESLPKASYQGILPLVKGLENTEVDAIIINSAFASAITENDSTFLEWAELLGTVDVTKEAAEGTDKTAASTQVTRLTPVRDVATDPFIVYLTGMDTRTDEIVADIGNSDVNMVIAVNPTTKKILLVNIPRDYYWYLWGDQNYPDKITHAGCYGVDCSVETMSSLFGVNVNYYVKVGFNSVINIVDAIGGVTVNSNYDFELEGVQIHQGENYLDGYSALQFARERHALPGGDRARGMNQQEVIRAIVSKMTSVSMIPKFSEIISIVASNVVTSITVDDMEKLLKKTLDGSGWEMQSIQVDGAGGWDYCYSLGDSNDVMYPDWSTVDNAKAQIASVMGVQ